MKTTIIIISMMLASVFFANADDTSSSLSYEERTQTRNTYKQYTEAVKKEWGAKNVNPVCDIYNNNKLLGYHIFITGKNLQKKFPSYDGPSNKVIGIIDTENNIIVPFGKYSELDLYKNDTDKFLWFKAFTNDKKDELAHGVVGLDGREIVPPLYHRIIYRPGNKSQKMKPENMINPAVYVSGQAYDPSFEAYTGYTTSEGYVSVYGTDGSLRLSHIPANTFINLGKYIIFDSEPRADNVLNRLLASESLAPFSPDNRVIALKGKKLGLYNADGRQLLPNEYTTIQILATKDSQPSELDGLCYVTTNNSGVESCGVYDILNEKWVVPACFSKIRLAENNEDWKVWRDELSDAEIFNPENDYNVRFADEGAKLYNEGRYADAINYYASNGIESPVAKAYSAFALMKLATANYYTMTNDVAAVEYCMQNNTLWTKPLAAFDFNLCNDYLNMALATAAEYMTLYDCMDLSPAESKYHGQIESLQYSVDYYKKELDSYRNRYAAALNYVGNSINTVNAQQQAMQQAYINAFTNMFSNIMSSTRSSSSGKSSVKSSGGYAVKSTGGGSPASSASSGNDGNSVEWKKNRIRELNKQHDYYMKVIEREEARPEKSTSAMNLIQSSKRHLEEIDAEIRKWSN